jgi:hypothetical protein
MIMKLKKQIQHYLSAKNMTKDDEKTYDKRWAGRDLKTKRTNYADDKAGILYKKMKYNEKRYKETKDIKYKDTINKIKQDLNRIEGYQRYK